MEDEFVGCSYFANLCYEEHVKNYQNINIKFNDFYTVCLEKWDSLDEEAKEKIIQIAKTENQKKQNDHIKQSNNIIDLLNLDQIKNEAKKLKKNFLSSYSCSKRPRNSYIFFIKAARNAIKEHHINAKGSFIETNNAILTKYRECSNEDKKIFEELSLLDSKLHNQNKKNNPQKLKNSTTNKPKKINGFLVYCRMNRKKLSEQNPHLKMIEISTQLGSQWKALSENAKNNYNKIADKQKNAVRNTDLFLKAKEARNEIASSFSKLRANRATKKRSSSIRKKRRKTKSRSIKTKRKYTVKKESKK